MKYYIYIKSHCESPDYEDECEVKTRKEAIKMFTKRINIEIGRATDMGGEYDEVDINRYVSSEDDNCPICKTPIVEVREAREGGNYEIVQYCNGCGYTSTFKS